MATFPASNNNPKSSPVVNEHDPKYKCCCNCMTARDGVITIAILELIGAAIFFVSNLVQSCITPDGPSSIYFGITPDGPSSIYVGIGSALLTVIVIVLTFVGICRRKSSYLIPHLIYEIIVILFFIIWAIVFVVLITRATPSITPAVSNPAWSQERMTHPRTKRDLTGTVRKVFGVDELLRKLSTSPNVQSTVELLDEYGGTIADAVCTEFSAQYRKLKEACEALAKIRAKKDADIGLVFLAVFLSIAVLHTWFFAVVLKLYRYYGDLSASNVASPNVRYTKGTAAAELPPTAPNVPVTQV